MIYTPKLEKWLPVANRMENIWQLMQFAPYTDHQETDDTYIQALRENIAYHYAHNDFYRAFLDGHRFSPEQLRTIADLPAVPFIHANFFKYHVVTTASKEQVVRQVTSSGTSGQKSQHFLDRWTEHVVWHIADVSQLANGFPSEVPCNYLMFNYEPYVGFKTGSAITNQRMMRYAPVKSVHYALRINGHGGYDFDRFGVVDRLLQFQQEGAPVRMMGFAAFLNFTIDKLKSLGHEELPLHPDSRCLFGGGWKNHQDKEIPKAEFYDKIHRFFHIPLKNIRDKYGSVEHPVSYVECEQQHLHIPSFERVIVRDVKTLAPLPYGEIGFAQLISPVITSMPSHSILMGDLISLHPPESCACGRNTPWISVEGRAGTSKNKSCAIAASEILMRS